MLETFGWGSQHKKITSFQPGWLCGAWLVTVCLSAREAVASTLHADRATLLLSGLLSASERYMPI